MNKEEARQYVKDQLEVYLQGKGINTRRAFRCLSPDHEDKHPSMIFKTSAKGMYCRCLACGVQYDTFDLIGMDYGITNSADIFKKAYELFGIEIDGNDTQNNIHSTTYTTPQAEAEPDYTDFFSRANENIEKTSYHRGLSMEIISRFNLGYAENWKHPKAPKMEASPRLIIPTSKHSYLARYAGEGDFINYRGEVENKSKVGRVRIFNPAAVQQEALPVFVVEGEIDALSIIDVGGEALGMGSKGNVRQLISLLKENRPNQPLILALDNEKDPDKQAGVEQSVQKIIEELKALGIPYYRENITGQYKDANEALQADREAFKTAVFSAIDRVKAAEAEAVEEELDLLRKEAVAYQLQDFIKRRRESKTATFTPTGFSDLDKLLDGGLYAGLYIVGAITSLGKTTFCLQIADQIAEQGRDVLIFSLEMARDELIAKSVSRLTLIKDLEENETTTHAKTTRGILTGSRYKNYSQTETALIQDAITAYGQYGTNIYITEGTGDVGIDEIREKVKDHVVITGKAPVVLIDYLQIITPVDMRATDKQNTDKAVLELKRLSRDYGIPIIGISSFNRDNYTAPVNLASFKESGAIEYSSDVLIGLQYEGMDYQEGETKEKRDKRIRNIINEAIDAGKKGQAQSIQVKILKNRNGSKGDAILDFYPMFNYFKDTIKGAGHDDRSGWKKSESKYNR